MVARFASADRGWCAPASCFAGATVSCDFIAPWYRWMEYATFGSGLLQARCRFLEQCGDARKVLILGEGDGRYLKRFLRTNSQAEVDYVDVSARMLWLAKRRNRTSRVNFCHVDILKV